MVDRVRSSEIIAGIAERIGKEPVSIHEFLKMLGGRSFAFAILIFDLPNCIPTGLPAISTITGIPVMFFAAQLLLGKKVLWLPQWVGRKKISGGIFRECLQKSGKGLAFIERYLKPRLVLINFPPVRMAATLCIFIMAFILALPIIFGNLLPALAIAILALGLLEDDGMMIIAGFFATVIAATWVGFVVFGLAVSASSILHYLQSFL